MSDNARWVRAFGSSTDAEWDVVIDKSIAGWQHTGLYAGRLADGETRSLTADSRELVVVPLAGSVGVVSVDEGGTKHEAELAGRPSVFAGPTDVAYLPPGSQTSLTARGAARVAVGYAVTATPRGSREPAAFRHVSAKDVAVELRGAGSASREVRSFATPDVLQAHSIIACEVVTPAGNWSSYPPHKHDTDRPGVETELEEIYYFEVQAERSRPGGSIGGDTEGQAPRGLGYQRVYGTSDRPIDVFAEVRSGDVVLVPHGWHGPSMAAPGYDLYYLNVMAGPGAERAWRICDDPAHAWVRSTWDGQDVAPRLPIGGPR
ncbi:MAG: 5-deoxy-glucuronate isomerase [Actinomycetota bacterium]|nr:5-deoxy-glucuronate isomerase [Actinomycetota bacterium]